MKKLPGVFVLVVLLVLLLAVYSSAANLYSKVEITEKRNANTKYFINPNGSFTAEISQIPVHYYENGSWLEIDSRFQAKSGVGYDYAMTRNTFQLYFSEVSKQPQKFAIGDAWISFQPIDAKSIQGQFKANEAVYSDVWQNTDLKYVSNNTGLKEEIILKQGGHPESFSFKVDLHNLTYEQTPNGEILFKDKAGNRQAFIPHGVMEDAKNSFSDKVEFVVKDQGNHLILTVIPDQSWLSDKARTYPVIVDPTIAIDYQNVVDTYVTSYDLLHGHDTETRLEIGMNRPFPYFHWYSSHTLLKFNMAAIPNDAIISEAKLQLYLYKEVGDNPTSVSVYDVTSAWNSYVDWNEKPSIGTSFYTTSIDAVGSYTFNLNPQWVNGWISGEKENYGVYLDCVDKSEASLKYFYSSESGLADQAPKLVVTYEGGLGRESYWPYWDFSIGASGSAMVNLFNGNLVFAKSDISIPTRGFPLGFGLVYNSLNKEDNGFGYGWTSEANSKVQISSNGNLVTLIHADGSRHLFVKEGSRYIAPPGIDLQLTYVHNTDTVCTFKNVNRDLFIYDSATGRLLRKDDKFNNSVIYSYSTDGKLATISDIWRTILLGYTNNRLSSITNPKNQTAYYTYDSNGNLWRYQDFGGNTTTFTYDSQHNLKTVIDPKGNTTYFNYVPGTNKIQYVITADQYKVNDFTVNKTIFNYTASLTGFETTVYEPLGNIKKFTLNLDGTLRQKEMPNTDSAKTSYQYNQRRLTAYSDEKITMRYGYSFTNPDGIPDLVQIIIVEGSTQIVKRIMTYDNYHNVTSIKDAKQSLTSFQWSSDGKTLNKITDAENNEVIYTYDPYGQMTAVKYKGVDGRQFTNTWDYNQYGYAVKTGKTLNFVRVYTRIGYDILGNVTSIHDPDNNVKIYKYNSSNLLESVSVATATVTYPEPDPTDPTDPRARMTVGLASKDDPTLPYDPGNGPKEPIITWSPETLLTSYTYDKNYNLDTVTYTNQAGQQVVRYSYTPVNLVDIVTNPDGTYENNDYDANYRLTRTSYSDGKSVVYGYNSLNQLISINYPDGTIVSYTYDRYGNRRTMQDRRGIITYGYDQYNRLISESKPNAPIIPAIEYAYDVEDNLTMEKANGVMVSYTYNKVNLLKTVTNPYTLPGEISTVGKTTYNYDSLYNVTKITYPDNTAEIYTYDNGKRIKSITYQNILADTQFQYTYSDTNNVLSLTKRSSTDNFIYKFTYDVLGQLCTAIQYDLNNPSLKKSVEEFRYDPMGNRTYRIENGVEWVYTYDANNKLTQVQQNFGNLLLTSFTYDGRGSMTARGNTTYTWNDQFRLASVSKNGNLYNFAYDGDGRRYQQSVNGQITGYVLDKNWRTFHETDAGNNVTRTYINGLSTIGTSKAGTVEYNYHDFLGSTIATKDSASTQTYIYNLFGGEKGVVVEDFTYTDSPLNHGWKEYTGAAGTTTTEEDPTIGTRVMRVQSPNGVAYGIAIGYPPAAIYQISRNKLSVKYKANTPVAFYVRILGKDGKGYYLQYYIGMGGTSSVTNETYDIRLGSDLKDGKWRLLERDLQKDLKEGFHVEFDKVLWFCIRGGDYYLDDIRLEGLDLKDDNTRKFTDEDQDQTGLYYLRNRYYDPELGRFISQDSYRGSIFEPLSLNRYIYVQNNPLRYIDPSGNERDEWFWDDGIFDFNFQGKYVGALLGNIESYIVGGVTGYLWGQGLTLDVLPGFILACEYYLEKEAIVSGDASRQAWNDAVLDLRLVDSIADSLYAVLESVADNISDRLPSGLGIGGGRVVNQDCAMK